MGLFEKLFKKEPELPEIHAADDMIVAPADGKIIDIKTVSDAMFRDEVLGHSTAFAYETEKTIICAPANGKLSVLFPTGHAFGIQCKDGTELLVHIGIDTVNANGDGFRTLKKKQGDIVQAGDPIVEVDLAKLRKTYDMSTMLIVTNPAERKIQFKAPGSVSRGESVLM